LHRYDTIATRDQRPRSEPQVHLACFPMVYVLANLETELDLFYYFFGFWLRLRRFLHRSPQQSTFQLLRQPYSVPGAEQRPVLHTSTLCGHQYHRILIALLLPCHHYAKLLHTILRSHEKYFRQRTTSVVCPIPGTYWPKAYYTEWSCPRSPFLELDSSPPRLQDVLEASLDRAFALLFCLALYKTASATKCWNRVSVGEVAMISSQSLATECMNASCDFYCKIPFPGSFWTSRDG
jgi:hypothetical protein